ncbi:MAG: FAD-binding oxidoreductase [Hyphomonadaceae bacterium]|nr:FAD-binding oxidoreductase [Hyphomonadaceae bacterium]
MLLTDRLDLRGGTNCWREEKKPDASDDLPSAADVVVIGAGVMGAMVAERLARRGREVVVLDRRAPATGATAASTALVMWGADTPLTHLTHMVGQDEAFARWRSVFQAVSALDRLIQKRGIACGWIARPELYLAGNVLNRDDLAAEGSLRRAAGLPSDYLEGGAVSERFQIAERPALLSGGSYEVDPVALTRGLLKSARAAGATVTFPANVERLEQSGSGVGVICDKGDRIEASHVVLASGYEAARLILPEHFSLSSSFAIASKVGTAPAWGENALIWEASDPYLYTRATSDGRVIVGGEDEDFVDADKRDGMIARKAASLETKAAAMLARTDIEFDCAWAATFGSSPDGLPAIGHARNMDKVYLAYGFGGNGVTFASLGAQIIEGILEGTPSAAAAGFDPYRVMQSNKARGA